MDRLSYIELDAVHNSGVRYSLLSLVHFFFFAEPFTKIECNSTHPVGEICTRRVAISENVLALVWLKFRCSSQCIDVAVDATCVRADHLQLH